MEPMWNYTDIRDQTGRLVSSQFHHMLGINFDNGAYLNFWYNRYFELLDPNPARTDGKTNIGSGLYVDPGEYNYWDVNVMFRSNPARRVSFNMSWQPQTFWDGDRTDYSGGLDVRVTDHLATSGRFSRSIVDLPDADRTLDLASLTLDYGFSPRLSLRTLTQYNSYSDQLSTSARLRYTYRPGSDIYIVYDDVRTDLDNVASPFTAEQRDAQLIVKVTYLLSM
jgi:hypothetical protein